MPPYQLAALAGDTSAGSTTGLFGVDSPPSPACPHPVPTGTPTFHERAFPMTTLRTTVYLNHAHARFFGFDETTAQLRMAESFDLELPEHLTGSAVVDAALNVVFEQLNIDDPEHIWALRYRLAGNRSLSVGDVVVTGETAWVVAPIGWKPISAATLSAGIVR